MLKSLIVKELRENLWLTVIALGLYVLLVSRLMNKEENEVYGYPVSTPQLALNLFPLRTTEVPFVGSSFSSAFVVISMLFALGLGFQQSLKESRQGTYVFLLHRPKTREAIFLTKLAV